MSQHVQVYFHDESEAEAFKAKLAKYSTHDVFIDEIEPDDKRILVIPIAPVSSSNQGAPPISVSKEDSKISSLFESSHDKQPRRAVIDFEVDEKYYHDVLKEVRDSDVLLDQNKFN